MWLQAVTLNISQGPPFNSLQCFVCTLDQSHTHDSFMGCVEPLTANNLRNQFFLQRNGCGQHHQKAVITVSQYNSYNHTYRQKKWGSAKADLWVNQSVTNRSSAVPNLGLNQELPYRSHDRQLPPLSQYSPAHYIPIFTNIIEDNKIKKQTDPSVPARLAFIQTSPSC